ncbi:hypothetical protein QUB68_28190 [Microcoleus sp. A006_D1]|uniref:hypothetical protein n=1 Tax=Microcoleus sp. A006_D1 TaxID=3055267 RepID=UPI002FCEEC02
MREFMLSQKVSKTATGQFEVTYEHLPDFKLALNFNSIIQRFNLQGNFCLLHWQAKPFGLRRWGVYDGGKDSYVACEWNQVEALKNPRCLQLDETIITTVPTAVLYFEASVLPATHTKIG